MPPAFVLSQDQTLKLTGRCRPKPASKSESQITSACFDTIRLVSVTPFPVSDAPALACRIRHAAACASLPCLQCQRANLPWKVLHQGRRKPSGGPRFFVRSMLQGRALYARDSNLSNPNLHFFCSCHQRDAGAERLRAAEPPPLPEVQCGRRLKPWDLRIRRRGMPRSAAGFNIR